jgi:hypothetical protein
VGEQWLDTTGGTYVFKVWDGSAWRSESGTFVDASGDTMTGALGIIAGSAGSPGLYFSGDTNTGLYSPGADQLAISTNGTGRLFVDASGNIQLSNGEVYKTDQTGLLRLSGGNAAGDGGNIIMFGPSHSVAPGRVSITSPPFTGGHIEFSTGGSERMRLDSSGRVGLGASSPTNLFQATQNISRSSPPAAGASGHEIALGSSGYGIVAGTTTGGSSYIASTRWDGTATNYNLLLQPNGGNVGIGNSTPPGLLHVNTTNGNVSYFGGPIGITSGNYTGIQIGYTELNGTYAKSMIVQEQTGDGNARGKIHILNNNAGNADSATLADARLTITSAGLVGIGTTTPGAKLVIDGGTSGDQLRLGTDPHYYRVGRNSSSGPLEFYGTQSGVTGYVFGGVDGERARITSDGKLLVGTSTAPANGNWARYAKLVSRANTADSTGGGIVDLSAGIAATSIASGAALGVISFSDNTGNEFGTIICKVDGTAGAGDFPGRIEFSTTADGASSPTERMRIRSNGQMRTVSESDGQLSFVTAAAGTSIAAFYSGYGSTAGDPFTGTVSCFIWSNGNIQNTNNSYTAISDIKLKENVVDAGSQWADLKALRVRNYNLKEGQTHKQIGLVAQEVELISPGLVGESPDRDEDGNDLGTVTKSVNYSVLYMKAVKALQEAMERIETLEAKVAALEAS